MKSRLENAVKIMGKWYRSINLNTEGLNRELSKNGFPTINIDQYLENIMQQIKTADQHTTIAVIGTFNSGKSTLINSLLGLTGKQRLSCSDNPETSKCTRLCAKPKNASSDAMITYLNNAYPTKYLSWEEAQRYTNHQIEKHITPELQRELDAIDEIVYFITSDNYLIAKFFDGFDLLDLPGTGSGERPEDTEHTRHKCNEADYVFWVTSTQAEPDQSSLRDLQNITTPFLPIVNVWQCEDEGVEGEFSLEEYLDILDENAFAPYLSRAGHSPISYYAKEIDLAQQQGRELDPQWGKEELIDVLQQIQETILTGIRAERIVKQFNKSIEGIRSHYQIALDSKVYTDFEKKYHSDISEFGEMDYRIDNMKPSVDAELKRFSRKFIADIYEQIKKCVECFIDDTMWGTNLKAVFSKKKVEEELQKDFTDNYLMKDKDWIQKRAAMFFDEIMDIIKGKYADLKLLSVHSSFESTDPNFTIPDMDRILRRIAELLSKDMRERILPVIVSTIGTTVLLAIPGGAVVEATVGAITTWVSGVFQLPNDSKLDKLRKNAKSSAFYSLCMDEDIAYHDIYQKVYDIHKRFIESVKMELNLPLQEADQKLGELKKIKDNMNEMLKRMDDMDIQSVFQRGEG